MVVMVTDRLLQSPRTNFTISNGTKLDDDIVKQRPRVGISAEPLTAYEMSPEKPTYLHF
jgi:hypothetical protein